MTYRMIQVGTGGQGAHWCHDCVPPNVEDGAVEVVAAVDIDPDALENAREGLGLDEERCYTDVEEAFAAHDADFCSVVVPPAFHEDVVDAALAHDMHVISEKPIADSLEASIRIAEKVERAGKKMGVTMSHRFRRDVTTLRRQLRSGAYGPVDYLSARYAINGRSYGWADHLYEWDEHPLLIDGSVHHLDLLADLAGARCETIHAHTWNPDWSEYDGDPNAVVTMTFENGAQAVYEGLNTAATSWNGWGNEHVRAECRDAALVLDGHELEAHYYDPDDEECLGSTRIGDGESLPLVERDRWSNAWLLEQFVEWLDGGSEMTTNVRDNLRSMALVFAAIESAESGESVRVQEFLAEAEAAVETDAVGVTR